MYLYTTLLTLCLSVVSTVPIDENDDNFAFVTNLVEITNVTGELFFEEEHENIWRRKCEANGGPEAFVTSINAGFELILCLLNILNITALRIDEPKISELEEVFPKYCARKDQFVSCFHEFVNTSRNCFEETEVEQMQFVDDIVESIVKFFCFRGGERMTIFIADKGPECIGRNHQEIDNCVNTIYEENNGSPKIKEIPRLVFNMNDCLKLNELQRCVVRGIETCGETTVNFLDSMFSYVRKSTPCMKLVDPVLSRRHARN